MDHHDRETSSPTSPPAAKRQRVLACRRCRHRKQRCSDDGRPCKNCRKSGEECIPTEPAPRFHIEGDYVRALEQRIAELESLHPQQSLDHIRAVELLPPRPPELEEHGRPDVVGHLRHSEAAAVLQSLNQNGRGHAVAPAANAPAASAPGLVERQASVSSPKRAAPRWQSIIDGDEEDEAGLDHMILGLVASPVMSRGELSSAGDGHWQKSLIEDAKALSAESPQYTEEMLIQTYAERAHCQYPFLHFPTFLAWRHSWMTSAREDHTQTAWQGFFVHMVYSTALLLLPRIGRSDSRSSHKHGLSLLPYVLQKGDPVLTVQAYLLLSMHALHSTSTERIISLASTTMRFCVQEQLHLHETEPEPLDGSTRLANQFRRRTFWCAYKLDRAVASAFDLPMSIPDSMITVKMFANVEDEELMEAAKTTPIGADIKDNPGYTGVSTSLHIIQCRRIQSEIMDHTLRWDYATQYASSYDWRVRILAELDHWKAQVKRFSDPASAGYTSHRWLAMIYHYTLLMLYRPTEDNIFGPAGDWSVQASSQACLMFRKSQMDRQIAHPWLGLLVQFQAGVTLLYCFWATPPKLRTENYDSPDVADALRACSNILAIMADRWPKAECLRDVFELLAHEVPLVDRPDRPLARISDRSAASIRGKLPQVRTLVVHRPILRMIEKILNEDFPRPSHPAIPAQPVQSSHQVAPLQTRPVQQTMSSTPPTPMGFEMPLSAPQWATLDDSTLDLQDLESGVPSFPGMFDPENAW